MKSVVFVVLLSAVSLFAQNSPPKYFLAAGAGWSQHTSPQAQGFLAFGIRLSEMNFTTVNTRMTSQSSSITQDFGRYLIVQENRFTLAAVGGLGVVSGGGSVGGDVSGGVTLGYDVSKFTKIPRTAVIITMKVDKMSGSDVKPVFLVGVAIGFGN